jgi:regulator of sigma E protease
MESILSVLSFVLYNIVIPLFILSFMIFVHELGHYLSARAIKAEIKEFAIGMGPKLWSLKSKKTGIVYALRAVPMGGALTLVGEDESSESENALNKKPVWQRFIMIVSGAVMNLLLGCVIMAVMVSSQPAYYSTRISRFDATATSNANAGLMEGDRILKVNGKTINIYNDLAWTIIIDGVNPMDITVQRNGEKLVVPDVVFPLETDSGITYGSIDFTAEIDAKNPGTVIRQTFFQSLSMIDMVWSSFFDLITGRFSMEEISGPVGVTQAIGNSVKDVTEGRTQSTGFLFLLAVITMNLGVFNLLPLPALDGGRVVFLLIEFVRRKPLKPEYEGYVHLAGFAIMILFMIFVTYKDIMKLIVG